MYKIVKTLNLKGAYKFQLGSVKDLYNLKKLLCNRGEDEAVNFN